MLVTCHALLSCVGLKVVNSDHFARNRASFHWVQGAVDLNYFFLHKNQKIRLKLLSKLSLKRVLFLVNCGLVLGLCSDLIGLRCDRVWIVGVLR